MKRIVFLVVFCLSAINIYAQEFNVGFHLNPILTTASLGNSSAVDKYTTVKPVRLGYNVGANLNFKVKKVGIELALNMIGKSMKEEHRVGSNFGYNTYYTLTVPTTTFEFPLMLGYMVHKNKKEDAYFDLYVQAGAAYELNSTSTKPGKLETSNLGANKLAASGAYAGPAMVSGVTPVVGVKVNAIVRNLGLIDYGVYYHFPLQENGPYNSTAKYSVGTSSSTVNNSLYARLSFIDIKFCYYFYSVGREGKKIRYKGL